MMMKQKTKEEGAYQLRGLFVRCTLQIDIDNSVMKLIQIHERQIMQ